MEENTDENALKVFISHSNECEDRECITEEIIPKLQARNIKIYGQDCFVPGSQVLSTITKLVNNTDRTLLFISKNALKSPWCSFELLISLERAQRTNWLSVVLLLYDVDESEIPHIAVLQEAPKIYFTKGKDDWVEQAVEKLREQKSISHVMPAGNVAHGLVWSHFNGYLQYVLPMLKNKLESSEWYIGLSEDVKNKVSSKLYEMVPSSCTCKHDLPKEDHNIQVVTTLCIGALIRGGNQRDYTVNVYSVTNGEETYYCMCEYPNVIGTMKEMEKCHLARFSHTYPASKNNPGEVTAASFTTDDKKLQLGRFYYTMNSVLSHFDDCRDTARVVLFNDERQTISEVLIEAIREDLTNTQKTKDIIMQPHLEKLECTEENIQYEYQVYIAHTDLDHQKASEIAEYLIVNDLPMDKILLERPGHTFGGWLEAAHKCRWFIILLTKNALDDKQLTFNAMSALGESIYRRRVRVIPVVDRCEELYIPESLRWVTYIPFDDSGKRHLKSLHNIVSGKDIPMETQLLLPAGDVAYGLAWGYVTNYLVKVLPEVLENGIIPAFEEKKIGRFRCPHKLYIIIPKSCDAGGELKERKGKQGRIVNFTKTKSIYPFGRSRPYSCNVYKVNSQIVLDDASEEPGLYFVGQYAAPVTCLDEMRSWKIAGVSDDTMSTEAERFFKIVKNLMEQAVPDKAGFVEFIFFDDVNQSLADLMQEKIRCEEVMTA